MDVQHRSVRARVVVVVLLLGVLVVLQLGTSAWATPLQQPNQQTLPTATPSESPVVGGPTSTGNATN
ncbi:MAG: hypothetical protein HC893_05920 [Chloroflexaceae bacterium]|nr:hypothetical protein [Chloroflexaceae bacterium]